MQAPNHAINTKAHVMLNMSEDTVHHVPQKSAEIQAGDSGTNVRKLQRA
jgi:hypothetical protein